MLRIAVVEDDRRCSGQLLEYLRRFSQETGIALEGVPFYDGMEAVEGYRPDFDIVLMDIEMPYVDGMTAAKKIRAIDPTVAILFVTSMAQYAIEGYSVGALDYLLKPVSWFSFSVKLKKAVAAVQQRAQRYLYLPLGDAMRKVPLSDIYYVEVLNHYLHIHTASEEFVLPGSLREFAASLKEESFVLCNSGNLVNLRNVRGYRKDTVLLPGCELSLSRPRRKEFMQALSDYLGKGGL